MKSFISILIGFILIPVISLSQPKIESWNWRELNYSMFNKSDLYYHNITKILVTGSILYKSNLSSRQDTLYTAEFDTNANIISESYRPEYWKKMKRTYTTIKDKTIILEMDKDSAGIRIILNKFEKPETVCHIYKNGENTQCEYYTYDNKNRLIETSSGKDAYITYRYYYNDVDSLLKMIKIYKEDNIKDSIIESYFYDSENRLIEFAYEPSNTFCKNFMMLCDAGPVYFHYYYSYDTCNNSLNGKLKYCGDRAYMNYDWGFIEWDYCDSESKITHYIKTVSTNENLDNSLQETYGERRRTITYENDCDSEKVECLPAKIEFLDDEHYSIYQFHYLK